MSDNSTHRHEYMCPECSHINQISSEQLVDKYVEQVVHCQACKRTLEMMVADGVDNQINLVVTSVYPPK